MSTGLGFLDLGNGQHEALCNMVAWKLALCQTGIGTG